MIVAELPPHAPSPSFVGLPLAAEPYLSFEGRCEEAMDFYRQAIGARVTSIVRFEDAPHAGFGCDADGRLAAPPGDKVMHAAFRVGASELFATDGDCRAGGGASSRGFSLSLPFADAEAADRAFAALSDGGTVRMPLGPTSFAERFGLVCDRFGVNWLVTVPARP